MQFLPHRTQRVIDCVEVAIPLFSHRSGRDAVAVKIFDQITLSGCQSPNALPQCLKAIRLSGQYRPCFIGKIIDKRFAEHETLASLRPPMLQHLMAGHTKGPVGKVATAFVLVKISQQRHACLLHNVTGICWVRDQRPDEPRDAKLLARVEAQELLGHRRWVMRFLIH